MALDTQASFSGLAHQAPGPRFTQRPWSDRSESGRRAIVGRKGPWRSDRADQPAAGGQPRGRSRTGRRDPAGGPAGSAGPTASRTPIAPASRSPPHRTHTSPKMPAVQPVSTAERLSMGRLPPSAMRMPASRPLPIATIRSTAKQATAGRPFPRPSGTAPCSARSKTQSAQSPPKQPQSWAWLTLPVQRGQTAASKSYTTPDQRQGKKRGIVNAE